MCNVYREVSFSKKMFIDEFKMGFPLQAWVKKAIHEVETYWLFGK